MFGQGKKQEQQVAGGGVHRYMMREKMFSIGDDFWIENSAGQKAFKVDGKALRIQETLVFEDPQGNDLLTIKEKLIKIRDTMIIERNGQPYATIKKALITILREKYSVETPSGELEVKGNIVDHEYKFERGGHKVAEVSKKWFRVRDTYAVDVMPGEDDILFLAAAVAIDQMSHD
jgi:uncharacterized protein YxjI